MDGSLQSTVVLNVRGAIKVMIQLLKVHVSWLGKKI
jgi:hypothetical protein